MTFLNIDFRISKVMAKPLLEAVAQLVPAICARPSATIFYTATFSASKHLDTEDIVYALCAATLLIKMTKDLLLILHHHQTEMDTAAEVARLGMGIILTREVDTLDLPLMVDIEVVLLEVLPAGVAVLVAVQVEILPLGATCTPTRDMTERLSHPVDQAALVTRMTDLEVIEYHVTRLVPGTGAGENAAFGYLTKGCHATVVIMDPEQMVVIW